MLVVERLFRLAKSCSVGWLAWPESWMQSMRVSNATICRGMGVQTLCCADRRPLHTPEAASTFFDGACSVCRRLCYCGEWMKLAGIQRMLAVLGHDSQHEVTFHDAIGARHELFHGISALRARRLRRGPRLTSTASFHFRFSLLWRALSAGLRIDRKAGRKAVIYLAAKHGPTCG